MVSRQKTRTHVFDGISRSKAFLGGLFRGEPLLEIARRGLNSAGVSDEAQAVYASRVSHHGTAQDAYSYLSEGLITSDRAQDLLARKICGAYGPQDCCRLILDGKLSSKGAQETVIKSIHATLAPELAHTLLKSGKLTSEPAQKPLAKILFNSSATPGSPLSKTGGRIACKLLSGGTVASHDAQGVLSAMMLNAHTSEPTMSERSFELLLSGRPIEVQDNLSLIIHDEAHAFALLLSGVMTSAIAQVRLADRLADPKKAYDLIRCGKVSGKEALLRLAKTISDKVLHDGESLAHALTHFDIKPIKG